MLSFITRKKGTKVAKLGDKNNFYFNEELGRWVERGKEDEAEKEAAPEAPPTVDHPVEQRVMSGAGPASKYVDTGFGKPNATPSSPKVSVFPGLANAKAPPPGMNFFVPQAPAEPESRAEGIGLIEDHGELTHSGSGGSASPDVPRSNSNEAWSGQDSVKMGDPLSDFYGKSAEDHTHEATGGKDVFGVETDDEGSNGQLADPLDNIFGPASQDTGVLGFDPEGGDAPAMVSSGFIESVDAAALAPADTEPLPALSLDDGPLVATENEHAGESNGNELGPYAAPMSTEHAVDEGTDNQEMGADFGWTPEQTTEFYQWLDSEYQDKWRAWTGEEWNSFWTWFNNPEAHAVQQSNAENPGGGNPKQGGEAGMDNLLVQSGNSGLEGGNQGVNAYGVEGMHLGGHEANAVSTGAEIPVSEGQNYAGGEPGDAGYPEPSVATKQNKLGGSLPWSDELGVSPRTVEIRSEGTPKSELSGLLNGDLSLMNSDFAHLGGFLVQLNGLLKNLTPASDDVAKQHSECQEQLSLLLKSMEQKGVPAGVNGTLGGLNGQNEEIRNLTAELETSRSKLAATQGELRAESQKVVELMASLDASEAAQKKARDQAITHLREELESQYHERLAAYQTEIDSKDEEISRLKVTRASSLGEGAGGGAGGGDLHELRMALDDMEISHSQQLAEINKELEIKSAENDDLKRELDDVDAMQDELEARAEQISQLESKLASLGSTPRGESPEDCSESQQIRELRNQLSERVTELEELRQAMDAQESGLSALESEAEKLQSERQALQAEVEQLRREVSARSVGELSLAKPSAPQPETGKLMLAVGVAELQIRALSKELEGKGVNVSAFVAEALGPYLETK